VLIHHALRTYVAMPTSTSIFTSAKDGVWSGSRPGRSTIRRIECSIISRASVDLLEKRKASFHTGNRITLVEMRLQPVTTLSESINWLLSYSHFKFSVRVGNSTQPTTEHVVQTQAIYILIESLRWRLVLRIDMSSVSLVITGWHVLRRDGGNGLYIRTVPVTVLKKQWRREDEVYWGLAE
jgi:hypothetical protein